MIIGHQKIINFLDKSLERDKISQAYLFAGPENLGKFSVALNFAEKLIGITSAEINPDIIIIKPEIEPASTRGDHLPASPNRGESTRGREKNGKKKKKDIKIEQIRDLEHALNLSAYFGGYKVAIIDDADRMTISAQNSLLKTLEEPPKKCVLILICHNLKKIRPTIKSRCFIKRFNLVEEREMIRLVADEKNREELIFWSLGRPGIMLNLQKEKGELEKRETAKKELKKIFRTDMNEKFEFCENLSQDFKMMEAKLNWWVVIFRNEILGRDNFLGIAPEKSLEMAEEIQKSLELIKETNSNPKAVLENLVLRF